MVWVITRSLPRSRSSWFWFVVIAFSFAGAFVAWLVNRGRPGARAFLYVGIGLLVLTVMVGAGLAVLITMSR